MPYDVNYDASPSIQSNKTLRQILACGHGIRVFASEILSLVKCKREGVGLFTFPPAVGSRPLYR
jgi:hypothetical protein